ncbi:hypothetical protein HDU97_005286 [Phlyctochytrium planicorne]|nr:hypothetical protein HDU97_005286 [Phlyctochytrium planicorne]
MGSTQSSQEAMGEEVPNGAHPRNPPNNNTNNAAGAGGAPAGEEIPMTPANNFGDTDEPIAAAYFGEASAMYFGPHFIVNSSSLTSGNTFASNRTGNIWNRLRNDRRRDTEAGYDVGADDTIFTMDAARGNVFWPDLVGKRQDELRGVPGVGVRRDITDEEIDVIRNLYKQPPPSEIRVTTTLQCLTNLKKNTLRLVPVKQSSFNRRLSNATANIPHQDGLTSSSGPSTETLLPPPISAQQQTSSALLAPPTISEITSTDPLKPQQFQLEFEFDSSVPCTIRIHWVVREALLELADGTKRTIFLPKSIPPLANRNATSLTTEPSASDSKPPAITSRTYGPFPPGLHQKFVLPEDSLLDPTTFEAGDLSLPERPKKSTGKRRKKRRNHDPPAAPPPLATSSQNLATAYPPNSRPTTPAPGTAAQPAPPALDVVSAFEPTNPPSHAVEISEAPPPPTQPEAEEEASGDEAEGDAVVPEGILPATGLMSPFGRRQGLEVNPDGTLRRSFAYFPLVVEIAAVDGKGAAGAEGKSLQEPGMPSINSQSTYATLIQSKDGKSYEVKILKQKVMIENTSFTLQDIYGFTDATGTGSHEPLPSADDMDLQSMKECVVCMSDPKDTIVLPCRHLCLCRDCAEVLRFQGRRRGQNGNSGRAGAGPPRCPICRQAFHSLLQINLPKPFKLEKAQSALTVPVPPLPASISSPSTPTRANNDVAAEADVEIEMSPIDGDHEVLRGVEGGERTGSVPVVSGR